MLDILKIVQKQNFVNCEKNYRNTYLGYSNTLPREDPLLKKSGTPRNPMMNTNKVTTFSRPLAVAMLSAVSLSLNNVKITFG